MKFLGDAILCIYGAPVVNDSHATVAVKAAVDASAAETACFVKLPCFLNLLLARWRELVESALAWMLAEVEMLHAGVLRGFCGGSGFSV